MKGRRIILRNSSLIDMSALASIWAMNRTNISTKDIDIIILVQSTLNDLFESVGQLQIKIWTYNVVVFDIMATCSNFIVAVATMQLI